MRREPSSGEQRASLKLYLRSENYDVSVFTLFMNYFQASINLVYFAHFGWPWNGKGGYANPWTNCHPETSKISDCLSFATNWITFVSCGSSILMVMYGTVVGIRALIWMRKRQARQEEKERRIYYNTQEIRERMERREKKTSWTLVDYQEEFKS